MSCCLTSSPIHTYMHTGTRAGKIDVEVDGSRLWIPEESKIKDPKAYVADLVKTRGAKTPCFLTRPKKRQPWIVETYLRLMRRKLFADAFPKSIDVSPLLVTWPSVPTSCITKTISYLSRAKRPVIVIGSQALIRGPEYVSLFVFELCDTSRLRYSFDNNISHQIRLEACRRTQHYRCTLFSGRHGKRSSSSYQVLTLRETR